VQKANLEVRISNESVYEFYEIYGANNKSIGTHINLNCFLTDSRHLFLRFHMCSSFAFDIWCVLFEIKSHVQLHLFLVNLA